MKIEVKNILPEFVVAYLELNNLRIFELNGLMSKGYELFTLEARENVNLWNSWREFLAQDTTIDTYFNMNCLIAWKARWKRHFTIERTDKLISDRKGTV